VWVDPERRQLYEAFLREMRLIENKRRWYSAQRRLEWTQRSRRKPYNPVAQHHYFECPNRRDRLCTPRVLRRGYVGYIKERRKRA